MLKMLCGEGILPLLFTVDSTEGGTGVGYFRGGTQGRDALATCAPEVIRVYLGDGHA